MLKNLISILIIVFCFQGCIFRIFTINERDEFKGRLLSTFPENLEYSTISYDTVSISEIKAKYQKRLVDAGIDTAAVKNFIIYNLTGKIRKITLFCEVTEDEDAIVLFALGQKRSYSEISKRTTVNN